MAKPITEKVFCIITFVLALAQTIFSATILFGFASGKNTWGTISLWVSVILWVLFLYVGWKKAAEEPRSKPFTCVVAIATMLGAVTLVYTIAHIALIAKIAHVANILLWGMIAWAIYSEEFTHNKLC